MRFPRHLLIATALACPQLALAQSPAPAPAAQEITAVTVFGRLPRKPAATIRRLDGATSSSCAYFNSNSHADELIDNYLDAFHGRNRNEENHVTPETDMEGRIVNNARSFSDTAPGGDASQTETRSAAVSDFAVADKCGRSDFNAAAGRNYIARKDKSMDAAFDAHDKGDYAKALATFKQAYSKLGTDEAALMLGHMYLYGQGTAPDVNEAIAWYTKLSQSRRRNDQFSRYDPTEPEAAPAKVQAQLRLARIYQAGYKIAADPAKARRFYQDAVDLNHIPAHVPLAAMLLSGQGGAKDPARAAALLSTAAEHGYAPAQSLLARMYEDGVGVPQDLQKAFAWYQQAAFNPRPDGKKPHAQYQLAVMYDQGKGVKADPARALAFYKLAAVAGHPDAQNALATYFYEGQQVQKDAAIARKLFISAAAQGQPDAMFNAATMLFKGEGGGADPVQSYAWLQLASKLGNRQAAPALAVVESKLTQAQTDQARAILAPK